MYDNWEAQLKWEVFFGASFLAVCGVIFRVVVGG